MPAQVGAGVAAAVAVGAQHGVVHRHIGADLFGVGADVVGGDDGRALEAFKKPGDIGLERGLGRGVDGVVAFVVRAGAVERVARGAGPSGSRYGEVLGKQLDTHTTYGERKS